MNENEPTLPEESLFVQALEIGSADDRVAFLNRACGSDAELRRGVEALLRHHQVGSSFLEAPPTEVAMAAAQLTTSEPDTPALDFLSPSNDPLSLGRLGYYEVVEVLGHGGFGVVLKARDTKLDRIVAVKTLAQSLATSATARKRFVREAKAAAAVKHENVVGIYHVSDDGPVPYLVMECVSGLSLEAKLQHVGTLDLPAILRIGMQVASGLAAAHKQGLVHRDVKPGNILLENGVERVKITDFGLARAADDAAITRTGEVAGTPQYMSPEQAQGLSLDARSDLFSLGSVLYAMATGRSPFRAESTIAALRRVCDDTPRPIRETNADIPEWLAGIINRLLAKQPSERYQTATEVADLLGLHLAAVQQSAIVPNPKPTIVSRRHPSAIGSRWWSVALIALVAIACIMGLTEASGVTKVVPTVIRIVRGEGTLVIEASDPGVKVLIDGEQITIGGVGVEEVRLHPGTYKLAAMREGKSIKVDQEVVTISRNGRQVVRVLLESEAAKVEEDLPTDGPWYSLFNGKDLTGWQAPEAPSPWFVKNNILTCNGPHGYLCSQLADFEDFHLRAEVRINSKGNSGILVRTALPARDLIFNGHRYRFVRKVVPWSQAKREAEAVGGHLAAITSKEEDDWVRQHYGNYLPKNYTGFWLGASQAAPDASWKWVTDDSFAYTSWGPDEPNCQRMKDENQPPFFLNYFRAPMYPAKFAWNDTALGPSNRWNTQILGYLIEWENIENTSTKTSASDFNLSGYEAQICADIPGQPKTGSLFNAQSWICVAKVDPSPVPTDTWFKLEIIAIGQRIRILVNGKETADYTENRTDRNTKGHIGLQHYDPKTQVYFRKVEVKTLPSAVSASVPPADEQPVGELTPVTKLQGHTNIVQAVSFLPDGQRMVSVDQNTFVRTWDLETRSVLSTFDLRGGYCSVADVSADGRFVAISASAERTRMIRVWDLQNRKQICEAVYQQNVEWLNCIRFTPDGTHVLTSGKPHVGVLWNIATGKEVQRFEVQDSHSTGAAQFSPDGRLLAMEGSGRVRLFDVESGELQGDVQTSSPGGVISLAFSPSGDLLACGHMGGRTDVFEVNSRQLTAQLTNDKSSSHVVSMRFIDNERLLITRLGGAFEVWDLPRTKIVATAASELGTTKRLALSPNGRYALAAHGEGWDDKSKLRTPTGDYALRLWHLPASVWPKKPTSRSSSTVTPAPAAKPTPEDLKLLAKLEGHSDIVPVVAFVPDGRRIISVGRDQTVSVWDVQSRSRLSSLSVEGYLTHADVSTDGRFVAMVLRQNKVVQVWDLEKRQRVCDLVHDFHSINSIRFSPDGTRVVTSGMPVSGVLWDVVKAKELRRFDIGEASWTEGSAFSPDGRVLALGAVGRVRLFDAESGDFLRDVSLPNSRSVSDLEFATNGKTLAIGQPGGHVNLVDVDAGRVIASMQGSDADLRCLRFLDNGRLLLTSSQDGILRLWNIQRRELVTTATTEKGTNGFVSLAPDGRHIATANQGEWDKESRSTKGNGDYALRLWQLPESVWPTGPPPLSSPAETVDEPVTPKDP